MSEDMVNHPRHYTVNGSGVECIEVVEWMSFNLGNAVKYIWRCGEKGDGLEDLRKAEWYVRREIERISGMKEKEQKMSNEIDASATDEKSHGMQAAIADGEAFFGKGPDDLGKVTGGMFDTSTTAGKIQVMQADQFGLLIVCAERGLMRGSKLHWEDCVPSWNWLDYDYRIAPGQDEKLAEFVCFYKEMDAYRAALKQAYDVGDEPDPFLQAAIVVATLQGYEKSASTGSNSSAPAAVKRRIPCGPEDFPPGTVIREQSLMGDASGWIAVTRVRNDAFYVSIWHEATDYNSPTFMAHYERSLDGGKTWLPCWKEEV